MRYLVFWLPITLMLLLQLLGNKPGQTNLDIFAAGGVLLGTMVVLSFGMYVYANVGKSPHELYLQVLHGRSR